MGVGIGMKGYIGFGEESTYGTPVTRTKFLDILGESIQYQRPLIESQGLYRVGVLDSKVVQGAVEVGGDFSFEAQYDGWEKLAKQVFGAVNSTNIAGTAYKHLFTIADSLPTGLTFEVFRDQSGFTSEQNRAFIYKGCKINSMQFACGVGELLKVTCAIMGRDVERQAKTSETFTTTPLAVYHRGLLKWGGVDAEVSQFQLTLANGLDARPLLGTALTREPLRGSKVQVTGSFTAEFDSPAKFDDFLNAASRVLNVRFDGPLITGGLGQGYYIDMNINVGILTSVRIILNSPGRIMMEVDFKGYRTASINEVELAIQNTLTSV